MRTDITTKNTTTYTLTDEDFKRALEAIGVVFNEGTTLQFLPNDDVNYNEDEWYFEPGDSTDFLTVTTVADVPVVRKTVTKVGETWYSNRPVYRLYPPVGDIEHVVLWKKEWYEAQHHNMGWDNSGDRVIPWPAGYPEPSRV